jgi:hypothetical protein
MTKLIAALLLSLSSIITVVYIAPPFFGGGGGQGGSPGPSIRAPEIDPASAASALTLLMGGILVLRSRAAKR